MVWSNTAGLYIRSFELARRQRAAAPRESVAANGFGHRPHESPELSLVLLGQWRKLRSVSGRLPQPRFVGSVGRVVPIFVGSIFSACLAMIELLSGICAIQVDAAIIFTAV
jgi:hypothetical protein